MESETLSNSNHAFTRGAECEEFQRDSSSNLDRPVRRGADDVVAVRREGGLVDEGGVATELLERFARLEAVNSETERRR